MRKSLPSMYSPGKTGDQRLTSFPNGTIMPTDNNNLNIREEKITITIPSGGSKD